jgi:hypothetical protein
MEDLSTRCNLIRACDSSLSTEWSAALALLRVALGLSRRCRRIHSRWSAPFHDSGSPVMNAW